MDCGRIASPSTPVDHEIDQGRQLNQTSITSVPQVSNPDPVPQPIIRPSFPSATSTLETRVPIGKRALDAALICVTFPVVLPLAVGIGVFIKIVSPGPVLFRQERVGYREHRFQVLKFRSMHVNADTAVHESHTTQLLRKGLPLTKIDESGDDRLIPLGWLLRSSGLDELPQLLNVLRGEMSVVGPRPCTRYEFALLETHQKGRFRALPGMTGLWQVSGKNKTTFDQMIDLDTAYADHWSIALDLKILVRTFPVLVRQVSEMLARRWRMEDGR